MGYDEEEVKDKSWYEYIHPEDLGEAKEKHTQCKLIFPLYLYKYDFHHGYNSIFKILFIVTFCKHLNYLSLLFIDIIIVHF